MGIRSIVKLFSGASARAEKSPLKKIVSWARGWHIPRVKIFRPSFLVLLLGVSAVWVIGQNTQRIWPANPTRLLSVTEPDMRITAFRASTNAFHFTIEWNDLVEFPDEAIDILYSASLESPYWVPVRGIFDIESGLAGMTNVTVPFVDLALHGITVMPTPFAHEPGCVPVTNIVASPFNPGETYTNLTCACPFPGKALTGFFKVDILGEGGGGSGDGSIWGEPPWNYEDLIGTDPSADFDDPVDSGETEWAVLTGNYAQNVTKTLAAEFTVTPGQTYLIAVYIASAEYPYYTGNGSKFNDILSWDIACPGGDALSGSLDVNHRHGAWQTAEQNGVSAQGFSTAHLEELRIIRVPDEDEGMRGIGPRAAPGANQVTVNLEATNIGDGSLPSSLAVGKFPLKLVQYNMPNVGLPAHSTDLGSRLERELGTGANAAAYVTGEPAPADVKAWFKGLPAHVNVTWGLNLVSERPERKALDNRSYPDTTLPGNQTLDIKATMNNEIIGGRCTLKAKAKYENTEHEKTVIFPIRGKNPLDTNVRAYMNLALPEFAGYAWGIAQHESRDGKKVFNQFNCRHYTDQSTGKAALASGTPNKTAGNKPQDDGWGIGQVTITSFLSKIIPTAVVWDWKANIVEMNRVLTDKRKDHQRFMLYFAQTHGSAPNWFALDGVQPYTFNNVTLSAEAWAIVVLYNGGDGVRPSSVIKKVGEGPKNIESPWAFANGAWTFSDNGNNYAYKVSRELRLLEATED